MDSDTMIVITVVAIGAFLGVWGASLVVRALASRAFRVASRLAGRIPKSINTAPAQLSRLQFWFGMTVGPVVSLAGTTLAAFVIRMVLVTGDAFRWSTVPPLMLLMFGAGALVVGLRWDRAKGRRRCPTCWYDYTGLAENAACPECGHVPASARSLTRTRRSRPVLLAAPVLLVLAWVTHMTPLAMRTSWRAYIPTTVLIAMYEHLPDTVFDHPARTNNASLINRIQGDELWDWQKKWLGRRAVHLISTSKDPRTCARSSGFLYGPRGNLDISDADATAANMLRVGLVAARSADVRVRTHSTNILSSIPITQGPLSRAAFKAEQSVALDHFGTPVGMWDHAIYGRLIANFASPSDDVVACIRAVALDPQWSADRRDEAAALLGLLASRDASLLERLQAEYAQSQGDTRAMLALAMMSTRVQRRGNPDGGGTVEEGAEEGPRNSAALAEFMRDPDIAMRRAAIKAPLATRRLTRPVLDWERTQRDLAEVAAADPSCAAIAIRSMGWGEVRDEVVPVIARILDTGSAEDVITIAPMLRWSRMDRDWVVIHGPLSARVNDPALDQPTKVILTKVKQELDAIVARMDADAESVAP